MLVVGDREEAEGTVGVRHRAGGDLGARPADAFAQAALTEVLTRAATPQAVQDHAAENLNVRV
jgi:threonyl-tRNA synthetase